MEVKDISNNCYLNAKTNYAQDVPQDGSKSFISTLDASISLERLNCAKVPTTPTPMEYKGNKIIPNLFNLSPSTPPNQRSEALSSYAKQAGSIITPIQMRDWAKYKDDQLLRNPGDEVSATYEKQADPAISPIQMSSWARNKEVQSLRNPGGDKQAGPVINSTNMSGWAKYKDDQLLRNPGGDHYYLDENRVADDPKDRATFLGRIGKDIADVFGNIKNFFANLLMGSKIHYRDENNQIKEGKQRGLIGSCVDFIKDMGSALTFGLWHPTEDKGPDGFMEHLSFAGSKLKDAFLGDLVEGIPQSVNHMGKNVVLAGLNLFQVIPDATIGNLEGGRKLTTTIFDNGQVMVEYLTDIVPTGDAWFRVHASSLKDLEVPIVYNLKTPEYVKGDGRWQYVRNTPFRKTIETVGSLLADIATVGMTLQTGISTNREPNK